MKIEQNTNSADFFTKQMIMIRTALLFISLLGACRLWGQESWHDTVQKVEQVFSRYKPGRPGAQLAIARNGKVIFSKAWGMAELQHGIPMTTGSILEIASVSKQFVAAAILHLEQEGKLSLEDEVTKYIPEIPSYGAPIRIRHLLQQTSGLRDWENLVDMAGWPSTTRTHGHAHALYIIARQKALNHTPGAEHSYSNSNYVLLAMIVQKASGISLSDYTSKIIFEPAGMQSTSWRTSFRKVVPRRATAYVKSGDDYYENMSISNAATMLSTAEDLIRWNEFYLRDRFGNPSLLSKQLHAEPFGNGMTNSYRSGLLVDSMHGYQRIGHTGATAGYRANLEYFPALGLSIAFLSNTSEFDFDKFNIDDEIRKIFLNISGKPEQESVNDTALLSPALLALYSGWYRNVKTDAGLKLYQKQGKLYSTYRKSVLLNGKGADHFFADSRVVFSGKGLTLINDAKETVYYEKQSDTTAAGELSGFAGNYRSGEADAYWKITLRAGKLYVWQRPGREFDLQPTYRDGFDSPAGSLFFIRNKKGMITGFRNSTWRARGVLFEKLQTAQ